MRLFTCHWLPVGKDIKAVIFLCHGYAMECSVYTRETGIRLARAGYAVYGIDYEGHGKSEGLRCYIFNFDNLVTDCEVFFRSISEQEEYFDKPRFLYGESMGDAVAILLSERDPSSWSGLVLVAPMCKVRVQPEVRSQKPQTVFWVVMMSSFPAHVYIEFGANTLNSSTCWLKNDSP